jgi:hypothetical protein
MKDIQGIHSPNTQRILETYHKYPTIQEKPLLNDIYSLGMVALECLPYYIKKYKELHTLIFDMLHPNPNFRITPLQCLTRWKQILKIIKKEQRITPLPIQQTSSSSARSSSGSSRGSSSGSSSGSSRGSSRDSSSGSSRGSSRGCSRDSSSGSSRGSSRGSSSGSSISSKSQRIS